MQGLSQNLAYFISRHAGRLQRSGSDDLRSRFLGFSESSEGAVLGMMTEESGFQKASMAVHEAYSMSFQAS